MAIEIRINKHKDGSFKSRLRYKDGLLDGVSFGRYPESESSHPVGHLSFTSNYKEGKADGVLQGWYPNGKLKYKTHHRDGKDDGPHERWQHNGQLFYRFNYNNGKREGVQENYSIEGMTTITYYLDGDKVTKEQFTEYLVKLGQEIIRVTNLEEKALGLLIATLAF